MPLTSKVFFVDWTDHHSGQCDARLAVDRGRSQRTSGECGLLSLHVGRGYDSTTERGQSSGNAKRRRGYSMSGWNEVWICQSTGQRIPTSQPISLFNSSVSFRPPTPSSYPHFKIRPYTPHITFFKVFFLSSAFVCAWTCVCFSNCSVLQVEHSWISFVPLVCSYKIKRRLLSYFKKGRHFVYGNCVI